MDRENRQFRMGSLFDGSGGFPLAASLCGIEPVWASEVEPFPIKVTKARFPNMKHYGDISKINGADLEPVDLVTGGSPCFIAGTLIQTDKGLVPIEDVKVGDKVLTHTNTYQKVEKIGHQQSQSIIKMKMMGSPEITTTENHPFYVRKSKRDYSNYVDNNGVKKRHNNKGMLEPQWLPAKELTKGYYVGFSINNESRNERELTECECYLIGRYIADGYINESHRPHRKNSYNHKVIYCVGKGKLEDFKNNVTDYHVCAKANRTVTKCEIISQRLVDLCKECGKGAMNKTIPQSVMDLPPKLLEKVLDGYMSGDGCFSQCYKATTISRKLAYQLQKAVAKVYGTYAKVYFCKRPPTHVIEGRVVNQHDTYIVQFQKETRKQDKYICQDGMLWVPFVKSEPVETTETVYNMQVANDNSYTANNFTVHNCQSLSVAGKRHGMSKKCLSCGHKVLATEESDICPECGGVMAYTRSGLFMEQIRVIKEMRDAYATKQLRSGRTDFSIRPRFMLWENVTGAFSSNKGEDFRAVLEETARIVDKTAIIPRPPKGKWNNAGLIMADGYSIAWRTLDAQFWGVPQRRRRIALVADFGGQCAGEILFKRDGLQRNFTESRHSWQSLTGCVAESVGETGQYSVDFGRTADRIQMNADKSVTLLGEGGGAGAKTGLYCLPQTPITMQVRCGKEGGGKGPLLQNDLSATLSTSNVQTLFQPKKAYGICSYESNSMKSDNPNSGIYEADTSRTLDGNGGNPACNQGGIVICEPVYSFEPGLAKRDGAENRFVKECTPTLRANMGDNQTAVCYSLDRASFNQGKNAKYDISIQEDISQTLVARGPNSVMHEHKKAYRMEAFGQYSESDKASCMKSRDHKDATDLIVETEYIVRRLTPLECSRLQGFPDWWIDNIAIENPSEEDLQFWREVFETHRKVVTGAAKPKTDKQIIKWLKEPDTDGAKYKLWGNGIALPCFLYVMEGIKEVLERETSTK